MIEESKMILQTLMQAHYKLLWQESEKDSLSCYTGLMQAHYLFNEQQSCLIFDVIHQRYTYLRYVFN